MDPLGQIPGGAAPGSSQIPPGPQPNFPSIDSFFGASLAGSLLASILLGIITVQSTAYFNRFRQDPWSYKSIVALLWFMQLFQVIVTSRAHYYYLISSKFDPLKLEYIRWEMVYYGTHTVLASVIVQAFFVWRILRHAMGSVEHQKSQPAHFQRITKAGPRWAILSGIVILILLQAAFGLRVSIKSYLYKLATDVGQKETWDVYTWLALAALADTAIATTLTVLLRLQKTGFEATDRLLDRLVIYGIQTGLITSVLAIIICLSYSIGHKYSVVLSLGMPLGGIYTVTLLANLHVRTRLRASLHKGIESSQLKSPISGNSKGEDAASAITPANLWQMADAPYHSYAAFYAKRSHPIAPLSPPPPPVPPLNRRQTSFSSYKTKPLPQIPKPHSGRNAVVVNTKHYTTRHDSVIVIAPDFSNDAEIYEEAKMSVDNARWR